MILVLSAALAGPSIDGTTIEGMVLDGDTGGAIAGAAVIIDGEPVFADGRGRFTIAVPPGTRVTFRAPGYVEVTLPVPDGDVWRVRLPPEHGELELVIEARRDDPVVSVTSLDRERVEHTPGTFEDPVRLVQSLPGVAITPEYSPKAGDISLRGAAPGESRFLLDGIDLPYLFHFNGYSSVLHTRMLDELTLWPSTYGANWGGATGGIIETKSRWDPPEGLHGSVNANLVMAGAEVSSPINEQWAARVSGRRSYLDAFSRDDEQYTVFPTFWDYFGRVEYTPWQGRTWGLMALGAGDAYTRYSGEPTELVGWEQSSNPQFVYDQHYHVIGVVHHDVLGRSRADGVLAFVDHEVSGQLPAAFDRLHETSLQVREDRVTAPSDAQSLAYGAEGRLSVNTLTTASDRAWPEVARESALLGRGVSADERIVRFTGGVYFEGRLGADPVRLVPGMRIDIDTLTDLPTVDGRLQARWRIGPDTRLRVGVGTYSQHPTVTQLSPTTGVPDAGPARSQQIALGFDHAFAGRLEVGADAWAKAMQDLILTELDGSLRAGVEGEAWGVELTSRYRMRDRFFASIALAFGHATRDGIAFDYDQPWSGNLTASWSFRPSWNVGLRYRIAAGLPYTPVEDGLYQAASDTYSPVYGDRNSWRYRAYQKVDGHVERSFYAGATKLTAYAELWWVPRGSNVMYLAYRYDYDDVAPVSGPAFIPLIGVRGER